MAPLLLLGIRVRMLLAQKAKLGEPEDLPEIVNDLDWQEEVVMVQENPQLVLASATAGRNRLYFYPAFINIWLTPKSSLQQPLTALQQHDSYRLSIRQYHPNPSTFFSHSAHGSPNSSCATNAFFM